MDLNTLKVYGVNVVAVTASTYDMVEDRLKILLLLLSIAYTIQKMCDQKNKNKKKK